jgi:hypothetical protein
MIKKLLFFSIIFMFQQGFSQTDTCAGAPNLTVGSNCATSNYSLPGSFNNSMGDPSCSTSLRDGWYSFTTDAITSEVTIACEGNRRLTLVLYSGTCSGTLAEEDCITDVTFTDGNATLSNVTVSPSTTYFVRLIRRNGGANNMAGTICITTSVANDLCANATTLNCGDSNINGSTNGTTSATSGSGCGSGNNGVWYTFVGDGNQTTISSTASGGFDHEMAISSGNCAGLTSLTCQDIGVDNGTETYTFTTTNGTTYYIYIADWLTGSTDTGDFTISRTCATVTPPPNDDCSGAAPLTVNTPCNFSTQTNEFATDSGVANPGCAGYAGADVWFSVVVPASGNLVIDTDTGDIFDGGMAIYSGTCAALTLIECDDDDSDNGFMPSITRTGLTPGDTIYIRFWDNSNFDSGAFDICVSEPPPPPTNTDCASAEDITCGQTVSATTNGTTGSIVNGSGCAMSDYGVWYHFVGDGNQTTIDLIPSGSYDTELAVMQGSCGALTNLICQDGFFTESYTFTTVNLVDYYIYVAHWDSPSSTTGNFTLELSCAPPNCTPGPGTGVSPLGLPNLTTLDANGNNPAITPCGASNSINLEASYLQLGDPSDYAVSNISYNPPYQFDCLTNQFSTFSDDTWSPSVPMDFDFCFYDNATSNAFSSFVVAANGVMSFDNITPGSDCGYINDFNVPNAINASDLFTDFFFGKSIYGVHHDIDPTQGGEVGYQTITLDTGERALIMSWHDIPMFSDNSILFTGMIVLYEHSNVIEVYIEEKSIDNNNVSPWNDGNATVAIQNNATTGLTAPNRNSLDTNWDTTQEAWRFTPNGGGLGSISNLTWYEGSATVNGGTTTGLTTVATTDIVTVSPSTDTTFTAEIIYTFCDGTTMSYFEEILVQVSSTKTWNGSLNTNWYEDANWTPVGRPTSADCVIIPDITSTSNRSPIADISNLPIPLPPQPALARNISVLANGTIEIKSNTFIEVVEWVDVDANALFLLRDSASLVQIAEGAPNTNNNSGLIHMQRIVNNVNAYDYIYWSSPVEDFNVEDISPNTASASIFKWAPTQAAGGGVGNHGDWQNANPSELMNIGLGYIIRDLGGATLTPDTPAIPASSTEFIGRPNNGIITQPISRGTHTGGTYTGDNGVANGTTNQDDNWNLVGNPYPSAISYASFMSANNYIDGTIYLWTHQNAPSAIVSPFYQDFVYNYSNDYIDNNYSGSNPPGFNGSIASGQAFFVQMLDNASTSEVITFNNSMRSPLNNNDQFYREAISEDTNTIERHRIWLDLITEDEEATSLLVGYIEGATNEKDRLFDGYDFEGSSISFYSLIGDEKMAIQGRSLPFNDSDSVPLGIILNQSGNFTIAINTLDGLFDNTNQTIYIEDTYTNTIQNIRLLPFTFSSESGTFNDRFVLRYADESLSTSEFNANGLTIIAPKGDYIKVNSTNNVIETIIVYDLLGRILYNRNQIHTNEFTVDGSNLSDGTYIVKAILTNNKFKIQKIILKQ